MKSSFLLSLIFGALLTTTVYGQTTRKTKVAPKKKTTTTTPAKPAQVKATTTVKPVAAQPTAEAPKSAFDKFWERMSINYFGIVTTPVFKKWNSEYAAISPEWSDPCKNCDTYSMNLWSQVNFAYDFGTRMKFNIIPRWTTFFVTPDAQEPGERSFFMLEDTLVGFSGVVLSSDDGKFAWWMRPGVRLPTSHFSRTYNHPDWGRLTYQLELLQTFSYDFTKELSVGLTFQERVWIYDNRYNWSRHRHLTSPYVSYKLNDKTKVEFYYEHIVENNKNWKSINGKDPIYYNVWQNAYVGVGYDITERMNLFPFISAFVNDVPFSTQSFWGGLWISYKIK